MTARLAFVLAASFGVLVSAQQTAPPTQPQVYRPGPGIENPVAIRQVQPKYTAEAMRAQIQGTVELEGTVGINGQLTDIRVLKSLDVSFGLDQEAIAATRQWLFRPGMRNGQAVPVIVTLVLEFRLQSQPPPPTPATLSAVSIVPGDDFYTDTYSLTHAGLGRPIVKNMVMPKYTSQALRAKIQGTVEVEAVIQADGTVGRTRVVKPLDTDLDATALEAARQWTFEPGTLNGMSVPVVVKLTLGFRIH